MPILGIDYEKCTNCKNCLYSCYYIRYDRQNDRVNFEDPYNFCNLCGHCIGKCPVNAISFKDFGETIEFGKGTKVYDLIPYDTLHKFMSGKRSIRLYKATKVPREVMKKIVATMSYAATGGNVRRLKCLIVSDDEKIKTLSDLIIDEMLSDPATTEIYKQGLKLMRERGRDPVFYKAPHLIILYSNYDFDAMNSTIALTQGMLSAQSLGLGSCWIGMAHLFLNNKKQVKKDLLGIEDRVWGVIILGYPAVKFYRIPPRPLMETRGLEELK